MGEYTLAFGDWLITANVIDWSPYIPAKTYGPPENCEEADGGKIVFEILVIQSDGGDAYLDTLPTNEEFAAMLWQAVEDGRH